MVKNVLTFAMLAIIFSVANASSQCTKGSEFEPPLCPLKLPKISRISIEQNAVKFPASQDASVTCSDFVVTASQIRRYFAQAKATNAHDAHYTLDWSPCSANGEIFFEDGSHGVWSIDQFRSGTLAMSNGDNIVLYCRKCRFRPFQ